MSISGATVSAGICPAPAAVSEPGLHELLSALPAALEPVQRSRSFRLRLVLVGIVLTALLAVYVALVVVTSYGVWSHVASERFVAMVRRLLVYPVAYGAFCVAGPILCVFLVKPLFTMWAPQRAGVTLDRSLETQLFAYVDRLCELQRAPAPRQICVNLDINASASLRHGLIGLFRDDLKLTIGLPLVRAMTLREFTGVLAHEFGHFAQGSAMRLSHLIRVAINLLLRIAYERDGFDRALVEASQFRAFLDIRVTLLICLFALFMLGVQGFLWLARMLMRGLAWVGLAASGSLLREMEYDADRHEARIAGGESFAVVSDQLTLLQASQGMTLSILSRLWQSRRLVDDMPALLFDVARQLNNQPEVVEQIRKQAMEAVTGRLDTHPAPRDRLASVAREAEPGSITLDAPASCLFSNLDQLCKRATHTQYEDMLGSAMRNAVIVPVAELMHAQQDDPGAITRLGRFTQGCPLGPFILKPDSPDTAAFAATAEPDDLARQLETTRQRVLDLSAAAVEASRRLAAARKRHTDLAFEAAFLKVAYPFPAPSAERETAIEARRQATIEIRAITRELEPFTEAITDRLRTALQLGRDPRVAAMLSQTPATTDRAHCDSLAKALVAIGNIKDLREGLESRLALLCKVFQRAETEAGSPILHRLVCDATEEVRTILMKIQDALDAVPHPFSTAVKVSDKPAPGPLSIGANMGSICTSPQPADIYNRGVEVFSHLGILEERIISSLALAVEHVEAALGLAPLPDPPPDLAESQAAT